MGWASAVGTPQRWRRTKSALKIHPKMGPLWRYETWLAGRFRSLGKSLMNGCLIGKSLISIWSMASSTPWSWWHRREMMESMEQKQWSTNERSPLIILPSGKRVQQTMITLVEDPPLACYEWENPSPLIVLVVEPTEPLWKIWAKVSHLGWWHSQLNGNIDMFQTTNQ